jgi:hypothetical protein
MDIIKISDTINVISRPYKKKYNSFCCEKNKPAIKKAVSIEFIKKRTPTRHQLLLKRLILCILATLFE